MKITKILSFQYSLLEVLGFAGMIVIGWEFIKWQRNEITKKLVLALVSVNQCITSYIRFIQLVNRKLHNW